ncbi:MAG: hypothetical protein WCO28_13050 [Bacteroidota bacterium]|jgi:hypothetical protein
MSALISISVKQNDSTFKKYTISISDTSDQYGNNVSMYEEQTKEERELKTPKKYFGNGKVFWNDGKITNSIKKEKEL